MAGDVATTIAEDMKEKVRQTRESGADIDWNKTYDAVILGNKYTVTAIVRTDRWNLPLIGDFKAGTTAKLEILGGDTLVGEHPTGRPRADNIRKALWDAHNYYLDEGRFL